MIPLGEEERLAAALEMAAERNELSLLYQPKLALQSGGLAGVEALMRWQSPEFGLLLPATFIPVAERCGAIDELTVWGLTEVMRQWIAWSEQGLVTSIAFNISALTLRDGHFPDFLQRKCQIEGMPCGQLTLEVTESATQHAVRLLETITRFRIKGVGVELDDFGTGFSSLLQLRQLPYTGLKVDPCFIQEVARDPEARLIVKSVIDLAHGLGLRATAEGVENEETLEVLRTLDCDQAQGFFIAPPLNAAELLPWMMGSGGRRRLASAPAAAPQPQLVG